MIKWTFCVVFAIIVLLTGLLLLRPERAVAHDWYPPDCCSGFDCFPVDESEIVPAPGGGYIARSSGQFIPSIRESQDGRWHLCTKTGEPTGKPICGFEPPRGY